MCYHCGNPTHGYPSPYVASAMHPYVMAPTPMGTPYASPYATPYASPYPSPGSVTIQLPPTGPIPMMTPGTTLTVLPPPPAFMPSPGAMICAPLPSGPGGFSPHANMWNTSALQSQLDELNKDLEKVQAEEELLTSLYASQVKKETKLRIGADLKDCLSKIAELKKRKQKLAPMLRMYGISDD